MPENNLATNEPESTTPKALAPANGYEATVHARARVLEAELARMTPSEKKAFGEQLASMLGALNKRSQPHTVKLTP